ncbi:unnamed protein product [Brachionus calyciflorus]|uniref:MULE transposase domain-containing protein n=1 Tax=Brachionus calyciflorus TaxID=104777 RepID=A0A814H3Y2_9BILA|nr:unnamed protein product [Brachionus calyciflorus]
MSANNPDTKPRKIILECTKGLSEEVVANLPTFNAARQTCSRARINPYEEFEIPSNLSFILPEKFKNLENGEKFLFLDETYNGERMLIFTTQKNLSLLIEYKNWLCDGTFDAAPLIFVQLFTLHALKKNKTLPLVYALFTNKQESTYKKFFEFIKSLVKIEPCTISCDFELAIINSIESVFPETDILGCFFHLKKSIWRQIQNYGLVNEYNDMSNEDNNIRLYAKMIACLAFVPCRVVITAFGLIKERTPNKMKDLISYFEEYYIGKPGRGKNPIRKQPRFDIRLWNCYERTKLGLPRTNNNLEGWHNGIQSTFRTHPHLLSFIDGLKLEQANCENLNIKLSTGETFKRLSKYVIFENKLSEILIDFDENKLYDYLKNLSLIIDYKFKK